MLIRLCQIGDNQTARTLGTLESMLIGLMPRFLSQLPELRAEYPPIPLVLV
jgi:hypothetical protein